ncbi:hypothetical protein Tco_1136982 [Tanacetum coccineum]
MGVISQQVVSDPGSRRWNHTTWRRPLREEQRLCLVRHILHIDGRIDITEDINIVVEHGLSSENTQSPGGSSDTSEGSENSESFEESGRSDEGLML